MAEEVVSGLMPPFAILGTPRSRTAWLSKFLTWGKWHCYHEPSATFRSQDDIRRFFNIPFVGASDSALTLRWREILACRPDCRLVVVRRDLEGVLRSLEAKGVAGSPVAVSIRLADRAISDLRAAHPVLFVPYEEIGRPEVAARIFETCLGEPMPIEHWRRWEGINVQIDIAKTVLAATANLSGLHAVYPEIW